MRVSLISILPGLMLLLLVFPLALRADTIILKSGEKFTSSKIWEENGVIRFSMHGLNVKVDKQDVASIVRDHGVQATKPAAPLPPTDPLPAADKTPPPTRPKPNPTPPPTTEASRPASPQKKAPPARPPAPKPDKRPLEAKGIRGTGIQGLAWQMSPGQIPGLVQVQTAWDGDGIVYYARPGEPLRLGRARLDGMIYGFWQERLYSLMYWVAGPPGYTALKEVVIEHYGQGTKGSSGLERFIWCSANTDRMLEFDENLNTGIFWMRSRQLDAQIKRHPQPSQ